MDVVTYALAKKLTEFPMMNYIKNGDFSSGYTGWEQMVLYPLRIAPYMLQAVGKYHL